MLYFLIIMSVLTACLVTVSAVKYINVYQLTGYNMNHLFEWIFNKKNTIKKPLLLSLLIFFLLLLITAILNTIFSFDYYYLLILYLPYLLLNYYLYSLKEKMVFKKPLVITMRIKRFTIMLYLFTFLLNLLIFLNTYFLWSEYILLLLILNLFIPVLIAFAHYLVMPIERLVSRYYIYLAKTKLKSFKNLKVIAITGSYGKTSTKHILTSILKEKYFAVCTPHSFNTPMGVTKSILNDLKTHHEIFVVEMGADKLNDIKELCNIVKPDYSVLTSIGNQHLKSFKTMNNLIKTKYQIMTNLKYQGTGFFNTSNEIVRDLYLRFLGKKCSISLTDKNAYSYASQIKTTSSGSEFFVNIKGRRFKLKTVLLGEHNIINILMAVTIADFMGLNVMQIKKAVSELKPIKNRLELIKLPNGATILDDSFNSNPNGALEALKVLSAFEDKNKIVITPGMVELGKDSYTENFKFGKQMALVADKVYVVNELNKEAICNGLRIGGLSDDNIYIYDTFKKAFESVSEILSYDDVLLIENDLPDSYI